MRCGRTSGAIGVRAIASSGAGEGNRTLVVCLGSFCSTIELHPRSAHSTRVSAVLTTIRHGRCDRKCDGRCHQAMMAVQLATTPSINPTAEREASLKQQGWRVHIQRKGCATKGISDTQKLRNRHTARPPRTRVRRAGANGGKLVRCMGIVRVTIALHLKTASYNLKRLVFLNEGGLAPF